MRTSVTKVKRLRTILLISLLLSVLGTRAEDITVVTEGSICNSNDSMFVYLTLTSEPLPVGNMDVLTIRPVMRGRGGQVVFMPAWHIMGRQPYYRRLRGDLIPGIAENDICIWEKRRREEPDTRQYACGTPYEAWMDSTSLEVIFERTDECGVLQSTRSTVLQEMKQEPVITLTKPEHIVFSEGGTANIAFLVNDTRLLPGYRNNSRELKKITESIGKVLKDTTATIKKLFIHGYASPDGWLDNNERLARERTDSLKSYIIRTTPLKASQIETASTAEDWEGMRQYISNASTSAMPHRQQMLDIMDGPGDPDDKERAMKQRYPADWKHLANDGLPKLRRTDYRIDYTRSEMTKQDTIIEYEWSMPPACYIMPEAAPVKQPFRPIIAVKTNVLYDCIAAPNVELEIRLGKKNKYSIMGEWCNPWYVWHNNSRAYEIQYFGVELRKWYGKCRATNRTPLTGFFMGIYAAGGKYDVEWDTGNKNEDYNGVGDQGEFGSVGLSFGYAWPIAPHVNFELSGAVGGLYGPRRHYHGEFGDTHLIWKYNSHIFWVGPTKVKMSLVFFVGNTKRTATVDSDKNTKKKKKKRKEAADE